MRNNPTVSHSVRVQLVESGGLHLATSSDLPTLWATSFDLEPLLEEVEHAIWEYYDAMGFEVRAIKGAFAVEKSALSFRIVPLRLEAAE